MSLLKGKKGLIMGVANDRSIAWGIAKKLSEHGAELAFTYLGDTLKKRVVPLAQSLKSNFTLSCDVEKKEDVVRTFDDIKNKWEIWILLFMQLLSLIDLSSQENILIHQERIF